MGRLRERQVCRSLDEVSLATLADHDLERAIVEYVDERLGRRGAEEDEAGIIAALPPGVRALYLTWTVESEVINGGFARFFSNRAGEFASQAVAAFELFSAGEHVALMREAIRVHDQERGNAGVHGSGGLELLDDCFHQLVESLSALRVAKIRCEPRLFCDGWFRDG